MRVDIRLSVDLDSSVIPGLGLFLAQESSGAVMNNDLAASLIKELLVDYSRKVQMERFMYSTHLPSQPSTPIPVQPLNPSPKKPEPEVKPERVVKEPQDEDVLQLKLSSDAYRKRMKKLMGH